MYLTIIILFLLGSIIIGLFLACSSNKGNIGIIIKNRLTLGNFLTVFATCLFALILKLSLSELINTDILANFSVLFSIGVFRLCVSAIIEVCLGPKAYQAFIFDPGCGIKSTSLFMNSSGGASGYGGASNIGAHQGGAQPQPAIPQGQVQPNVQQGQVQPNAQQGQVQPNAQQGQVQPNAQQGQVQPAAPQGIPPHEAQFPEAFAQGNAVLIRNQAVLARRLIPGVSYQPYATELAVRMARIRGRVNNSQDIDDLPPMDRAFASIILGMLHPDYNPNIHYVNTQGIRAALRRLG